VLGPALVGLTACGATSPISSASRSVTGPEPPARSAAAGSSATGNGHPSESAAPSSGSTLGDPVATRSAAVKGTAADVELYPIARDGTLVHVTLALRSDESATVGDALSDNRSDAGQADSYAADGITLIDAEHGKLYLVASDGRGHCLCTQTGPMTLGESPTLVTASFRAPPAAVTRLDVSVPSFGVFAHVPLA
jgi:hypothetical protein